MELSALLRALLVFKGIEKTKKRREASTLALMQKDLYIQALRMQLELVFKA